MDWSLVLNVILAIVTVWSIVDALAQRKRAKAQVKIWLEQANGVNNGLLRIINDKWHGLYKDIDGITNTVHSVQASALALWTALYEERVLKEKDYRKRQEKIWAKNDTLLGLNQESTVKRSKSNSNS